MGGRDRFRASFDRREPSACAIGFLATRKGVAERALVETALELCRQFDHRGAPGHGAGMLLDIPWPLLLDRFPEHARAIAQRDVALGSFFLPFDAVRRRRCVEAVEDLAALGGADVLGWCDVPLNVEALPPGSPARRTAPVVRQALFRRPAGSSEEGWFLCRFLLRLALDEQLFEPALGQFAVSSLSNRTVVYRGLAQLSRLSELYPDLRDEHVASRFVLFHSRYSTNTTTSWRRAQPFWGLAHNGEIATVRGNVAWMDAIGRDLVARVVERHPRLRHLAARVGSIVCSSGSDSANLDDMMIALVAGGMSMAQALVALLPEAPSMAHGEPHLAAFHEAMAVFLGACDGPAAIVACDGDEAVAHLDRNGLRPLWITASRDYALAASELTGTVDLGALEVERLLGPGETAIVRLADGDLALGEEVHRRLARQRFPLPRGGAPGGAVAGEEPPLPSDELARLQTAFGMTRDDLEVVLAPLVESGKLAVGSMGDDTPPAALLDRRARRLDDYFQLRFAQETSPPIDPIRDAWVFETTLALGCRAGLWSEERGPFWVYPHRILRPAERDWLLAHAGAAKLDATFPVTGDEALDAAALETALDLAVAEGLEQARGAPVVVVSDRGVDASRAPLPLVRLVSRLHREVVDAGLRHRIGLVADAGAWDVHQVALLVALGADAVVPWLGCATAGGDEGRYLAGLRTGFVEAMSMTGVTPASAYCGAQLVEAIGLDRELAAREFPGVPVHAGGIGADVLDREALAFHAAAFLDGDLLPDAGEFKFRKGGRPHFHSPESVQRLQAVSGWPRPRRRTTAEIDVAYAELARTVALREPVTLLDLVRIAEAPPVPLEEVEPVEAIAWRFFTPGMSEGALSEPAHRAVARGMNLLWRWCRLRFRAAGVPLPGGLGPFANSGEGGFDPARLGRADGNRSIQYAGARFTVTPATAARAEEAEIKFAQGAKPGKGGQLPGGKVSRTVAARRGCEPGFELVSPPVNHNLYSIEDVKLMLESWRLLNPRVACALKLVATHGVEMAALGGVAAGADRIHLSDGCGGTGAAKRVDQKHAGAPVAALLPVVHDALVEEGVRDRVELSVDGGLQTGEQVVKLALLGADRFGFGTSALIALGCSMLRSCHLAGPAPGDATGKRRIGCSFGVATQDPLLVARFTGRPRQLADYLLAVARDVRARLAALGARRLADVVGRRDLLARREDLVGKAARLDLGHLLNAPHGRVRERRHGLQGQLHAPPPRVREEEAAERALGGEIAEIAGRVTNVERGVGVTAAGIVAKRCGDSGLAAGRLSFRHRGAAGHFYAAYCLPGMDFRLEGVAADSCFTAAHGGRLVVVPEGEWRGAEPPTLVGNTFAYGARRGTALVAGRGGNRFGICLRKSALGDGPRLVVEGVLANAFQYMTGGVALVLGPVGFNLGAGMTGGRVYLLDPALEMLNGRYVHALPLAEGDVEEVRALLDEHFAATASPLAACLLGAFDPARFRRVETRLAPEAPL